MARGTARPVQRHWSAADAVSQALLASDLEQNFFATCEFQARGGSSSSESTAQRLDSCTSCCTCRNRSQAAEMAINKSFMALLLVALVGSSHAVTGECPFYKDRQKWPVMSPAMVSRIICVYVFQYIFINMNQRYMISSLCLMHFCVVHLVLPLGLCLASVGL